MATVLQTSSEVQSLPKPPLPRRSPLSAVFRKAARILAANGHYQGDYLPDPSDRRLKAPHAERPLSIVAALKCAATGDPLLSSPLAFAAVAALATRLEVDGEGPAFEWISYLEAHIEAWGDVEGRTVESVVAVLEAAADASAVAL